MTTYRNSETLDESEILSIAQNVSFMRSQSPRMEFPMEDILNKYEKKLTKKISPKNTKRASKKAFIFPGGLTSKNLELLNNQSSSQHQKKKGSLKKIIKERHPPNNSIFEQKGNENTYKEAKFEKVPVKKISTKRSRVKKQQTQDLLHPRKSNIIPAKGPPSLIKERSTNNFKKDTNAQILNSPLPPKSIQPKGGFKMNKKFSPARFKKQLENSKAFEKMAQKRDSQRDFENSRVAPGLCLSRSLSRSRCNESNLNEKGNKKKNKDLEDSFNNILEKRKLPSPKNRLTSEERELMKCTFRPSLYSQKKTNIQSSKIKLQIEKPKSLPRMSFNDSRGSFGRITRATHSPFSTIASRSSIRPTNLIISNESKGNPILLPEAKSEKPDFSDFKYLDNLSTPRSQKDKLDEINSNLILSQRQTSRNGIEETSRRFSLKSSFDLFDLKNPSSIVFQGETNLSNSYSSSDLLSSLRDNYIKKNEQKKNLFETKSPQKLGQLLKNGYYYKHQEKKQFRKQNSACSFPHISLIGRTSSADNMILSNHSSFSGKCIPSQVRQFNISRIEIKDSSFSSSGSHVNREKFIFNPGYLNPLKKKSEDISENEGQSIAEELAAAKKSRIFKDLNIDPNLRSVFSSFNYKELMDIRKLHVLYASQKNQLNSGKTKRQGTSNTKNNFFQQEL